jgi:hypothetical protein
MLRIRFPKSGMLLSSLYIWWQHVGNRSHLQAHDPWPDEPKVQLQFWCWKKLLLTPSSFWERADSLAISVVTPATLH